MTISKIERRCPAKVNLALGVGAGMAEHGGLHPIASWMVAVDFADELSVERSSDGRSEFNIQFVADAPKKGVVDWPVEKDLVFRAHGLLERRVERKLPVRVKLRKRIPAGAGLGGGSSDAAGAMTAINELFELRVSDEELMKWGAELGSDVPFLIGAVRGAARGTVRNATSAIVSHLGERVEAVRLTQPIWMALVFPPFGCATGAVYKEFDRLMDKTSAAVTPGAMTNGVAGATQSVKGADVERVRKLAMRRGVDARELFNDLTEAACVVQPELGRIRKELMGTLGRPVHLSGSGSTLFVIAVDEKEARELEEKVRAVSGLAAVAARTVGSDW